MSRYLSGIHDREGVRHVPAGGWCLDTLALNDQPHPFDYAREQGVEWIVRLNFGYGSTGTIPRPARYAEFADLCADYVRQSRGVTRFVIGNEPNHSQERPDGQPIAPENYAVCFNLCRQAIQAAQPNAQVIPAPVAPWNVESGDWLDYWQTVLAGINGCEGLAVHSYIHEADPNLVNSDAKMDPPFQDRRFQFAAYRDTLARVPARLRHLPIYLTEANPLSGWQARGIIPAMLDNINWWNDAVGNQKIQCVIFYRYPPFDRWSMSDKPAVMDEFRQHAQRHTSPEPRRIDEPSRPPVKPVQPALELDIDERLRQRGVGILPAEVKPGQHYWRLVRAIWMDEREAGGRHHIYVDAIDENRQRVTGVEFAVNWPSGNALIRTEAKPGEPWAANMPMSPSRNEFSIRPAGDTGDAVNGIGMGADTPGGYNAGIHTSTGLVYQWTRAPLPDGPVVPRPQPGETGTTMWVNSAGGLNVRAGPGVNRARVKGLEHGVSVTVHETRTGDDGRLWARIAGGYVAHWLLSSSPPQPVAPTPPVQPPAGKVPRLVHPVENPAFRRITQRFGERPEFYSQYKIDGVPLRGHEGIDFGTPIGATIRAIAAGRVAEVTDQGNVGYGRYIKIVHPWGESVYAHLQTFMVVIGATVAAGQPIALSGNTGNSTGPHTHIGIRIAPFNRADGWGGYSDPLPYLSDADSPVEPLPPASIVNVVREAAREYGVDEHLLLALIWKESSYNPNAINQASGAKGLGQVMPLTWGEWSAKTGATNIFDARDNARVSSAYLNWCILTTGSERRGLWSYVWGIGRVLDLGKPGKPTQPPAEVIEYANAIIYGRDLLDAVLP